MDVSSLVNLIGCSPEQDNSITTKSSKVLKGESEMKFIMKYTHNKKSYNSKWETDPLLKTWIQRHPNDDGKVVCQFCQSVIRAHKNDLLEHTRTLKHQRNFMANSTPTDYNEFVIALNELRKDAQVINKKRSGKTSNNTSNSSNTILALPPSLSSTVSLNNNNNNNSCSSSSTINNNNCIISTNNNNSLSSSSNNNNNIMQLNSWTSITTSGVLLNNNNCKLNITSNDINNEEGEEDEDDDNLSRNDVDLCWSENNHEAYISANSPSDLVSVILEEQEQIGSPNDNSNSDCSVSLTIPTLTPIISINNSSSSISSPLHHHIQQQQQQQHTVQQTRLLKPDSTSSLLLSSVDVVSAIQDNYFNLSELIEISRSALDKVGQLVNGNSMSHPPSLIINNPPNIQNPQQQTINSQTRMDKITKRKAKKKSDKNLKKAKSIKTEGLNFALGLESL